VARAIEDTLPGTPAYRKPLFALARALKAVMPDARPEELRPVVAEWHRRAQPVVSAGFTDVWSEFLVGWDRVRVPAGQGVVEAAFRRAQATAPPARAVELYPEDHVRLLVSLCRELQRVAGDGPFYLDCRTAGRLVGVHHTTAWRLLGTVFVADGILVAGKKGSMATRDANEYVYVLADDDVPLADEVTL
jgi:hypothetical protein